MVRTFKATAKITANIMITEADACWYLGYPCGTHLTDKDFEEAAAYKMRLSYESSVNDFEFIGAEEY